MWDAIPGMQVVCIKDFTARAHRDRFEILPKLDQILTIRDVCPVEDFGSPAAPDGSTIFLRFNEIVNDVFQYKTAKTECAFGANNFRPVKKTDISVFTGIAAKPNKPVKGPKDIKRKVTEDA